MTSSFCFILNRVPTKSIYNVTSKYCTKGIVLFYIITIDPKKIQPSFPRGATHIHLP